MLPSENRGTSPDSYADPDRKPDAFADDDAKPDFHADSDSDALSDSYADPGREGGRCWAYNETLYGILGL